MTTDRRNKTGAEQKAEVLEKISKYKNKKIAERVHEIILQANPELCARLWYGMPGYAKNKDSAVIVFFREDGELMTIGLSEHANFSLNNSNNLLMPCAWFFKDLNENTELKIQNIVIDASA